MRIIVRPTSRPAWVGAAAVALVVGLVAGCSGGGGKSGPSSSSPRTSSPSSSPAQSPSPSRAPDAAVKPVRPAAMDQVSAAGAEAAAVYFLKLDPYVYATNDLTEWKALSHPECVFCASVIGNVEKQVAAGTRSEGGLVTIATVRSTVINPGRWWSVDVDLTQASSSTLDGAGRVVEDSPAAKAYHMDIAVVYEAAHWVVRELTHTRTD